MKFWNELKETAGLIAWAVAMPQASVAKIENILPVILSLTVGKMASQVQAEVESLLRTEYPASWVKVALARAVRSGVAEVIRETEDRSAGSLTVWRYYSAAEPNCSDIPEVGAEWFKRARIVK